MLYKPHWSIIGLQPPTHLHALSSSTLYTELSTATTFQEIFSPANDVMNANSRPSPDQAPRPDAIPESPMMPARLLPFPQTPLLTPPVRQHRPFNNDLPLPALAPPTTVSYSRDSDNVECRFGSLCTGTLQCTSAESIQRHLALSHTADVDVRAAHTPTRCQWWLPHGQCGSEVVCERLGEHIARVHLGGEVHVCRHCGWAFSRWDALTRHQSLHRPIRRR